MRKFITSSFEINLTDYKISTVEENHWFNDQFFTKYSFPFEIPIDDELNIALGNITDDNSLDAITYLEGIYVDGENTETAILEIEEDTDNDRLQATVRYGFDELPSFAKKLSELPLHFQTVENIYDHAESVITKKFPEVNYNFPQIHTDKITPEGDIWFAFEKKINNRVSGAFLENYVDELENLYYNKNIMQPLPYVLHIFKQGFADSGYNLIGGNVLDNEVFKKMLLFADVQYYQSFPSESLELFVLNDAPQNQYKLFKNQINLTKKARWEITGSLSITGLQSTAAYINFYSVSGNKNLFIANPGNPVRQTYNYDINIIVDSFNITDHLKFEANTLAGFEGAIVWDISISPIFLYDDADEPIPGVLNLNEINLKKAVPDMTFGDFVKVFKNWFNLDFEITGKNVSMNFIETQINYNDAFDLSGFQELQKKRKFNRGISFLLQFADFQNIDTETFKTDYQYKKKFQNQFAISTSNYRTDEKTQEITIDALPLPQLTRTGSTSAHAFEENNSKIYTVLYNGLVDGLNVTQNPAPMFLENVHPSHWQKWFDFRINAADYSWIFKAETEQLTGLKAKGKIFAYGRYMINKSINKQEIEPDLYQVEIEASSLK